LAAGQQPPSGRTEAWENCRASRHQSRSSACPMPVDGWLAWETNL
jgi:hypothetical protein